MNSDVKPDDIRPDRDRSATGNVFQSSEISFSQGSSEKAGSELKKSVVPRVKVTGKKTGKSSDAFRTIGEVAEELDVPQHVLRFWETKFSHVRPLKRGGGRRYYRPEDVDLLKGIHRLLYSDGYTIKGVQKLMREKGKGSVLQAAQPEAEVQTAPAMAAPLSAPQDSLSEGQRQVLRSMLKELKDIRKMIGQE